MARIEVPATWDGTLSALLLNCTENSCCFHRITPASLTAKTVPPEPLRRRTTAALADAVAADGFDGAAVTAAIGERAKSAARVADAVGQALGKIHGILRADQRTKLAYLLRTGALSI